MPLYRPGFRYKPEPPPPSKSASLWVARQKGKTDPIYGLFGKLRDPEQRELNRTMIAEGAAIIGQPKRTSIFAPLLGRAFGVEQKKDSTSFKERFDAQVAKYVESGLNKNQAMAKAEEAVRMASNRKKMEVPDLLPSEIAAQAKRKPHPFAALFGGANFNRRVDSRRFFPAPPTPKLYS